MFVAFFAPGIPILEVGEINVFVHFQMTLLSTYNITIFLEVCLPCFVLFAAFVGRVLLIVVYVVYVA